MALAPLVAASALSGCGGSAATRTVTVHAPARTVTVAGATRTVTVAVAQRLTVTTRQPTATTRRSIVTVTETRTVAAPPGKPTLSAPSRATKTVTAVAGSGPALAASYRRALAGLAAECSRLPAAASVPTVKGENQARTLALIVLPRALPLAQDLDRVSQTYAGSRRFLAAAGQLRRDANLVVRDVQAALTPGRKLGAGALAHALKALSVRAERLSVRECSD